MKKFASLNVFIILATSWLFAGALATNGDASFRRSGGSDFAGGPDLLGLGPSSGGQLGALPSDTSLSSVSSMSSSSDTSINSNKATQSTTIIKTTSDGITQRIVGEQGCPWKVECTFPSSQKMNFESTEPNFDALKCEVPCCDELKQGTKGWKPCEGEGMPSSLGMGPPQSNIPPTGGLMPPNDNGMPPSGPQSPDDMMPPPPSGGSNSKGNILPPSIGSGRKPPGGGSDDVPQDIDSPSQPLPPSGGPDKECDEKDKPTPPINSGLSPTYQGSPTPQDNQPSINSGMPFASGDDDDDCSSCNAGKNDTPSQQPGPSDYSTGGNDSPQPASPSDYSTGGNDSPQPASPSDYSTGGNDSPQPASPSDYSTGGNDSPQPASPSDYGTGGNDSPQPASPSDYSASQSNDAPPSITSGNIPSSANDTSDQSPPPAITSGNIPSDAQPPLTNDTSPSISSGNPSPSISSGNPPPSISSGNIPSPEPNMPNSGTCGPLAPSCSIARFVDPFTTSDQVCPSGVIAFKLSMPDLFALLTKLDLTVNQFAVLSTGLQSLVDASAAEVKVSQTCGGKDTTYGGMQNSMDQANKKITVDDMRPGTGDAIKDAFSAIGGDVPDGGVSPQLLKDMQSGQGGHTRMLTGGDQSGNGGPQSLPSKDEDDGSGDDGSGVGNGDEGGNDGGDKDALRKRSILRRNATGPKRLLPNHGVIRLAPIKRGFF